MPTVVYIVHKNKLFFFFFSIVRGFFFSNIQPAVFILYTDPQPLQDEQFSLIAHFGIGELMNQQAC